ncbi:MAG: hypothetical protein DCC65_11845 [Planctomycetota bacterium]|nr:MAG: hypothetical protein DCC65_11845 [Planctomycetota bacterium]
MKLPVLFTELKPQHWDCHGCTNCCRELVVHLTRRDIALIDGQNWTGQIAGPPYVKLGRETVLNHGADGACVFLSAAGRCRIHEEHGEDAKPLACRLYPFSLNREGDALRTTIRFDCPSAAASRGSGLSAHRGEVIRLSGALDEAERLWFAERGGPLLLREGREMSVAEHKALVDRLDRWLRDMNRSLGERLTGVAILVETLSGAKLEKLRAERFIELLDLLLSDLPEALREAASPPCPTGRQMKLLRMSVFSHCAYISFEQARMSYFSGLRYRWGQLQRSRRLAVGEGRSPEIIPGAGAPMLEAVPEVALDEEAREAAEELVTRYVRMRILSGTAFGAGYYGWAVLNGVTALLAAVCTADWIARYLAAGAGRGHCGIDEYRRAVGIVDRTAGRARELGTGTAALRMRYLGQSGGIRSLLGASALCGPTAK